MRLAGFVNVARYSPGWYHLKPLIFGLAVSIGLSSAVVAAGMPLQFAAIVISSWCGAWFVWAICTSGGAAALGNLFDKNGYLRANIEGLAVRCPLKEARYVNGLPALGIYRMGEAFWPWDEIEKLVHYRHTINFIPDADALHVSLRSGKTMIINRFFFSEGVPVILSNIQRARDNASRD